MTLVKNYQESLKPELGVKTCREERNKGFCCGGGWKEEPLNDGERRTTDDGRLHGAVARTLFCSNKTDAAIVAKDTIKTNDVDPLTPQSGFLLTVPTGLDKHISLLEKYRYGAIGTDLYFYLDNNKKIQSI
jgi:hypothetical protein